MVGYSRTNCLLCGKNSEGLPHFRFPFDVVLRSAWANVCNIDPASVTKRHKLCSRHFSSDDYSDFFIQNVETSRTRLKKDVIPTLELPREDANGILDPNPDQNVLGNNVAEQIETENDDNDIIVIEDSYADSDCFTNNHVDFSELPAALDLNIDDEMENDIDENDVGIDYDEYGEDIPAELNNLKDITRFINRKRKILKNVSLANLRLRKRLKKLEKEYYEVGQEYDIAVPNLSDLELDI